MHLWFLGLYGRVFPNTSDAAFSNHKLWQSLGLIVGFAYSSRLCTDIKLYILTALLGVATTCLVTLEVIGRRVEHIDHVILNQDD